MDLEVNYTQLFFIFFLLLVCVHINVDELKT